MTSIISEVSVEYFDSLAYAQKIKVKVCLCQVRNITPIRQTNKVM